ncbi:MAG TPA: hypothetical protein VF097_09065 [Actinomycetota bacterium]
MNEDQLFGLPLDEFTAARDELAAELRGHGERDAAAQVKALRRPTVAAWAVNQLARERAAEVQELLSLREELRAAQESAISGGGVKRMREIGERRRRVIEGLTEQAEEVLTRGGHAASRSTLDRVEDTLMAATLDEEGARAVEAGRLTRELTPPSGFESLTGVLAPPKKKRSPAPDRKARERARRAREEARAAEEEAERADREARELEEEAGRARRRADRSRRKAEKAAARAAELESKAEDTG